MEFDDSAGSFGRWTDVFLLFFLFGFCESRPPPTDFISPARGATFVT